MCWWTRLASRTLRSFCRAVTGYVLYTRREKPRQRFFLYLPPGCSPLPKSSRTVKPDTAKCIITYRIPFCVDAKQRYLRTRNCTLCNKASILMHYSKGTLGQEKAPVAGRGQEAHQWILKRRAAYSHKKARRQTAKHPAATIFVFFSSGLITTMFSSHAATITIR